MRVVLRNARWVCTGNDAQPLLEHAHVSVLDGRIEMIRSKPIDLPADEAIDLDGCLLLPGFVNLHHHFFQSLTRAVPTVHRAASEDWLVDLYPVWARMTAEDIAAASRNAAAELLLSGVTTSADHAFILGAHGDERTAAQIEAVQKLGLRLHLVRSCLPTIGGRVEARLRQSMGSRLDRLIDSTDTLLQQCQSDVERWHDAGEASMLRLALGPSNLTYSRPELMTELAQLAARYGCGLHAHYHPRPAERAMSRKHTGAEPIDFLDTAGWLRAGTWFAHCTEIDDIEIERFAARGVGIAHCPRTILRLGYRMPPIHRIRRAGINVGIGVDGAASNDSGAFIADLRIALLLHRLGTADHLDPASDWLTPLDALHMATRDGARILGRADIGTIAPGLCADLTAFDMRGVDCAGALADPLGGLLLAGSNARAHLTMVNGKVVVRGGRLVTGDEDEIAAQTNALSRDLLARATHGE